MATADLVLVDTCIWASFFNRPRSAQKQAVDGLLDDDRATLIGPIVAEILLGFRRDEQSDWVASSLRGLQFLEVTWETWRAAANLGRQLAARGHSLPLSDLAIAATALEHDIAVYTTDPHFDLLPEVKRFTP